MICHLFLSPLEGESRLFKELRSSEQLTTAESLLTLGLNRTGAASSGLLQGRYPYQLIQLWSRHLPRMLPFQIVKYVEWTLRAAGAARSSGPKIIHCHSLMALPAAVLAARFSRAKILYDAHELETKRANMTRLRQAIAAATEKFLMRFVDEVVVVSPSIRSHYQSSYPEKPISLLMNLPSGMGLKAGIDLRRMFAIPRDHKILLYVGGLAPSRGIELMTEAAKALGEWHFVFLGSGPLLKEIKAEASRNERVHYCPPVGEEEIINSVATADLSFCVIDCSAESYRFALPNKFFQSLLAGVPVIVNKQNIDMIEIGAGSGMVFAVEYSAEAIREFAANFRKTASNDNKSEAYTWESQQHILLSTYARLLG